jgi:hypothetical protein
LDVSFLFGDDKLDNERVREGALEKRVFKSVCFVRMNEKLIYQVLGTSRTAEMYLPAWSLPRTLY